MSVLRNGQLTALLIITLKIVYSHAACHRVSIRTVNLNTVLLSTVRTYPHLLQAVSKLLCLFGRMKLVIFGSIMKCCWNLKRIILCVLVVAVPVPMGSSLSHSLSLTSWPKWLGANLHLMKLPLNFIWLPFALHRSMHYPVSGLEYGVQRCWLSRSGHVQLIQTAAAAA